MAKEHLIRCFAAAISAIRHISLSILNVDRTILVAREILHIQNYIIYLVSLSIVVVEEEDGRDEL